MSDDMGTEMGTEMDAEALGPGLTAEEQELLNAMDAGAEDFGDMVQDEAALSVDRDAPSALSMGPEEDEQAGADGQANSDEPPMKDTVPSAVVDAARAAGVALDAPEEASKLRALQNSLQNEGGERDFADCVTRWRVDGAEFLERHPTIGLDDAKGIVGQCQTALAAQGWALSLVPEVRFLQDLVGAYELWKEEFRSELAVLESGRQRGAVKDRERLSNKRFKEMLERKDAAFERLNTPHRAILNRVQEDLALQAQRAKPALARLQAEARGARPSTKVLNLFYYELSEVFAEASAAAVADESMEAVGRLLETLEWRKQATKMLIAQASRTALVESEGTGVEAELKTIPASELDLEELERMQKAARDLGFGGPDATTAPTPEERILLARLAELVEAGSRERATVRELFKEAVQAGEAGDKAGDAALKAVLARMKRAEGGEAPGPGAAPLSGIWYNELDLLGPVAEAWQWFCTARPSAEQLQTDWAASLARTDSSDRSGEREREAAALERAEALLAEARTAGLVSKRAKASKDGGPDKAATRVLETAAPAAALVESLTRLRDNMKTRMDATAEQWRRGLVGRYVEVEWEAGDWYSAIIATYSNFEKAHILLYETLEAERVFFKGEKDAVSPEGDRINLRFAKTKLFDIPAAEMENAVNAFKDGAENRDTDAAEGGDDAKNPDGDVTIANAGTGDGARQGGKGSRSLPFEEFIVNKFIKVEWEKGEYFLGIVRSYDPEQRLHEVLYEETSTERMQLREDGVAKSENGQDEFRWITTEERFLPQEPASDEDYGTGEESSGDEMYDDEGLRQRELNRARQREKGGATVKEQGNRKIVRKKAKRDLDPKEKAEREAKAKERELRRRKKAELRAKREAALARIAAEKALAEQKHAKKRNHARTLFAKVLAAGAEALNLGPEAPKPEDLAKQLEVAVATSTDRKSFPERVRLLFTNLKKNKDLVGQLVRGELAPEVVCRMSAAALAGREEQNQEDFMTIAESSMVRHGTGDAAGGPARPGTIDAQVRLKDLDKRAALAKPVEARKMHMIDQKLIKQDLAAQAAAKLAELGAAASSSSSSSSAAAAAAPSTSNLPSLGSLLDMGAVQLDEDGELESSKGSSSRKRKGRDSEGDGALSGKRARGDVRQSLEWEGQLRDAGAAVCFKVLPGKVLFGRNLKPAKRLLPSCVVGLLGDPSTKLKLAGRARIGTAVKYLEELVGQSNRQVVLCTFDPAKSDGSGGKISSWVHGLETERRVGVVDQGKAGAMVYMFPRALCGESSLLAAHASTESAGIACFIVKPSGLPSDKLDRLLACKALDSRDSMGEAPSPSHSVSSALSSGHGPQHHVNPQPPPHYAHGRPHPPAYGGPHPPQGAPYYPGQPAYGHHPAPPPHAPVPPPSAAPASGADILRDKSALMNLLARIKGKQGPT